MLPKWISIATLFLLIVLTYSQNPDEFCATARPGTFCSDDLKGFYNCFVSGTPSSYFFQCAPGTICGCGRRVECDEFSNPCLNDYPIPLFPDSYISVAAITNVQVSPTGTFITNTTEVQYYDVNFESGARRTDTFNNDGELILQVYEFNGDIGSTIYTYNPVADTCESIIGSPIRAGVPNEYLFIDRIVEDGKWYDVYEFRENADFGGPISEFRRFITTVSAGQPVTPVREEIRLTGLRTSTNADIVYTSFEITIHECGTFVLPTVCL